uniref:Uncharacterized protein n=1 Tax=viral metagenome TaxID=1070528 RepID=A0A6C0IZ14_9ZZZZ
MACNCRRTNGNVSLSTALTPVAVQPLTLTPTSLSVQPLTLTPTSLSVQPLTLTPTSLSVQPTLTSVEIQTNRRQDHMMTSSQSRPRQLHHW